MNQSEVDHPKSDNEETMTTPSAAEEVEKQQQQLWNILTVEKKTKDLEEQLKTAENAYRNAEREKQKLERELTTMKIELTEGRDQIKKLQQELLIKEKKAKDLEEQLKREHNEYGETEEKNSTIERQLDDSSNQVAELRPHLTILEGKSVQVGAGNTETAIPTLTPRQDEAVFQQSQTTQEKLKCRTKITTWNELIAFIKENQQSNLVIIHVYSHKSNEKIEADEIERSIVERIIIIVRSRIPIFKGTPKLSPDANRGRDKGVTALAGSRKEDSLGRDGFDEIAEKIR
ncbi:unnamed protein product [Darwinula stevensoni]|uniref:Uncharacterized protein n=1 Tax=Darwinula stevensoni TaxID=69355 RepID=A0A7R9A4V7_9CRUS|nr:unnamed protein product [Darwinula stevensoni]CAG0894330.1 unnamed protein product [Darwinula stevensoni]